MTQVKYCNNYNYVQLNRSIDQWHNDWRFDALYNICIIKSDILYRYSKLQRNESERYIINCKNITNRYLYAIVDENVVEQKKKEGINFDNDIHLMYHL